MAIFTFLNAQLVKRFGAHRTVRGLLVFYMLLAIILLTLTVTLQGVPNIFVFFAFVALLQAVYVAAEPDSSALALEPMGATAGIAAAIFGTSFFVIGSFLGSFIDRLLINSVTPLAAGYVIAGLFALLLVFSGHTSTNEVSIPQEARPQIGD